MYKRSISGNQLWDSIIFLITQPQVFRVVMNYNHRFLYLEYNTCIIFMYIHICLYAQHLDSSTSVP